MVVILTLYIFFVCASLLLLLVPFLLSTFCSILIRVAALLFIALQAAAATEARQLQQRQKLLQHISLF